MNFVHMPEIRWRWGYAFAWALILASVGAMFAFFRRRKWL
jgi:magnesium transporter